MQFSDPNDESSPYIPLPGPDAEDAGLGAWEAAVEYHRLKRILPEGRERQVAREAAISGVVDQAIACIRHAARPSSPRTRSWAEAPLGELDLEASLEVGALLEPERPEFLLVTQREYKEADIVLILDMSLSMTGEKIALVAVAASVLALKLPMGSLGVVAFDSDAAILKPLGESVSIRELVRRILEVPARGFTNLEGGMRSGLECLRAARHAQRSALLLSDGVYNVGWDPSPLAPLFPRLHVIQLGPDEGQDRGLCRKLAAGGRGRHYQAEQYADLPRVTYQLVQDLFR